VSPSIVDALGSRHVDQHASSNNRSNLLNAELVEAGAGRDLVHLEAVIKTVAMRLVGEAVELGADLPELSDDELLVAAAFVRCGVHDGALKLHVEPPRCRACKERYGDTWAGMRSKSRLRRLARCTADVLIF